MIVVEFVRGSATTPITAASYVGAAGMIVVDTDTWCLRVQDGVTAGGHEICPAGPTPGSPVNIDSVTTGTTHTVTPTSWYTTVIWSSSTGGAKTTNIPGAGSVNKGYIINVATTLGNGDTHHITPASGNIGGTSSITFDDSQATGSNVQLMSDGVSNWVLL